MLVVQPCNVYHFICPFAMQSIAVQPSSEAVEPPPSSLPLTRTSSFQQESDLFAIFCGEPFEVCP